MAEDSKFEDQNGNIALRQNLVNVAVNFLLNTDVQNKSDQSKAAFLSKKGLTDLEISAAFQQAKSDPRYNTIANQGDFKNSVVPQRIPPSPHKSHSFWSQLSSISSSLIVVAVALYGLHRFYKLYIEPWLFGTKPEKEQASEMKELFLELNNSISQLKTSVSTLEQTVSSQKEQIDNMFLANGSIYMPIPMAVAELKTEIGSVKSLLISRHQFPAVPKVVNPSIPLWQLPASETENGEAELIKPEDQANPSLDPVTSETVESESVELLTKSSPTFDNSSSDSAVSLGAVQTTVNGINDEKSDYEVLNDKSEEADINSN